MAKRADDKGPCVMPECGQPQRVGGFCAACYSWWHRVRDLTGGEFSLYIETATFRAKRMVSRLGRVGSLPKKTHSKVTRFRRKVA